ncbi:protein MAIN-LIKE 2-like [Gossypium arboreum]|uniref:protein MAIN-LIKE 2-like n=1 Tax=Gossypium arboreum TaxID=29729 RepID=UPI000819624B|nr:protein MAIN-LIKE 2-like [Gossypium arboreum]
MPYLELAGFGSVALIRMFDLRYDLISALVEHWRPETHTFHLPCGECTVTLEDVALQLGLHINGSAVTGVSAIAEPTALCHSLLGVSPVDDKSSFTGLKFSWLKVNFEHLSVNVTEHKVMCAAQAYITHIIGGVLMLDMNNNKVHLIHRQMPSIAAVMGSLLDVILGISYAPTIRIFTSKQMELLFGYREVVHCPNILSDD